jgi:acyl carrier protein
MSELLTLDKEELRGVVAEVLDVDVAEVTDDASFVEDLGVDSLMALEVMVVLERRYRVELEESELVHVVSLQRMYELLADRLQNRG